MRAILIFLLVIFSACAQDWQNRSLAQFALDFSPHGYIAVKSITNLKSQTPDNTNLFVGLGYSGKSWWLEVMAQKQYNANSGFWAVDSRYIKKCGKQKKTTLYVQSTPFLTQKAFGWGMYGEIEVWKKFAVGGETENIHKRGPDVSALGPRVSRRLGRFAGFDVLATGTFRLSPVGGRIEPRLYLVFNRRLALRDRK